MSNSIEICLISPPNRGSSATVPTALLYLHSWLTKNNIVSRIIDVKLGHPGVTLTKNRLELESYIKEQEKYLQMSNHIRKG